MTITYETTLENFEFWGMARENAAKLTKDELATLEELLEGKTWNRTELNDLFAYYFDQVCEMLGLDEESVLA